MTVGRFIPANLKKKGKAPPGWMKDPNKWNCVTCLTWNKPEKKRCRKCGRKRT